MLHPAAISFQLVPMLCAGPVPPVEEAAAAVEHVTKVISVGQVSIVDEVNAKRAVHKEWLGFLSTG